MNTLYPQFPLPSRSRLIRATLIALITAGVILCAQFVGKDPKAIDLKDPVVKAAHDKCEAAKKAQEVQQEAGRHQ